MKPNLLQLKDLVIGYRGRPLGSPLSISLPSGSRIGILGGNGSGKTTLLKTLLGLTPPVSGSYSWDEALKFGYVPQEGEIDDLFPFTIEDVVAMGAIGSFLGSPKDRMKGMLSTLELNSLQGKLYRDLSGGQKQRVLLGRALFRMPEVLLMDEPFNNLDYAFRQKVWGQIIKWQKEQGLSLLLIEHEINRIINHVDHILLLGIHKSFAGKTEEILTEEILTEAFEAPLHLHREDGELQVHFL
ncbi:MAG: ATP-binding cassette domain-containing protein [bacterium]|nr:ATP-binding cassette domain-containing protein [bacterium]